MAEYFFGINTWMIVRVEGASGGELGQICIYLYMNTCQAPHLKSRLKCFTLATTALFSTSEQTYCAFVLCVSKWVTVSLHSVFWLAAEVVTVLVSCYIACWCHVTLLPSQQKFSVHHTAMHQITVSLYPQSHIHRVHVCLALPALSAELPRSFACYCSKIGVEQWPFYHKSSALYHWAIPTPWWCHL